MSTQIVCDNCGKVLDPEEEHRWIKVGWRVSHSHLDDACSPDCARALVTGLSRAQRQIDREIEREEAAAWNEKRQQHD